MKEVTGSATGHTCSAHRHRQLRGGGLRERGVGAGWRGQREGDGNICNSVNNKNNVKNLKNK